MDIKVILKSDKRTSADLFVSAIFKKDKIAKDLRAFEPEFSAVAESALQDGKVTGKHGDAFTSYHPSYKEAREIMLMGLGSRDDYQRKCLRKALGAIAKTARAKKAKTVRILASSFAHGINRLGDVVDVIAEIFPLATYEFDQYKSKPKDGKPKHAIQTVEILMLQGGKAEFEKQIKAHTELAEGVLWARTVINEPGNVINPKTLSARARELAKEKKLHCEILEEAALKKLGMNGILCVGQGSVTPPALIILEHGRSHASKGTICLVGKGVTFDTGGISIKPSKDMEKMKYDMSGAAAVIAVMGVIADHKLPLHVVGLAPTAENQVANDPQRPGDIIKMFNGKSVEVINTDAEGRLILGDALSYAEKYKPKAILDIATLTGMAKMTFDNKAIAMLGNDAKLIAKVKAAGEATGERCWELPLWSEYADLIKGHHSDLLNSGTGFAGTITAAMFLKEFVPAKTPWVHLDIAGTAWCDSPTYDCAKGAYGASVRLLVELLTRWK